MITTAFRFKSPDRRFNLIEGLRRLAGQQQVIRRSRLIFLGLAELPRFIYMADTSLPLLLAILIVFLLLAWRGYLEWDRPDILYVSLLAIPCFRNVFLLLHRYYRRPVVFRLFYRRIVRPSNVFVVQSLRQGLFRLFRVLDPLRSEYHLIIFLWHVVGMRIYYGNEQRWILCWGRVLNRQSENNFFEDRCVIASRPASDFHSAILCDSLVEELIFVIEMIIPTLNGVVFRFCGEKTNSRVNDK